MRELRELAKKLLEEGRVSVVIGWEEGPRGVRPAFVTSPEDAEQLVFNSRSVHNLATYLNPRRPQVRRLGKPAVVVKACDAASVAALIRETQLKREDVVLIGVRCGGVVGRPDGPAELTPETVARRCMDCEKREPALCDHLVGEAQPAPPRGEGLGARLGALEAMPLSERWAFWTGELARCVRCHACREVCPLCFCERCVADKTVPQWIESSPHLRGNLAWQMTRALHQAGRCVGCGECERACPAGIPLALINRKLQQAVAERYNFKVSDDPGVPAPVGAFRLDDPQEFIR